MPKKTHRLAGLVVTAGLALALPLSTAPAQAAPPQAPPARVAAGTPLACGQVGRADDPQIATVLGLLGIVVRLDSEIGLSCSPAQNGSSPETNFCGATDLSNGLVWTGTRPQNHTCA